MFPSEFEVAVFLECVAVAGDTFFGDAVADVEIAFEFVADVVVAACFGGPAEDGVDFAEEGEVDVVVESEVVAAVFKVVSAVVHPTIVGHENAGGAVVSHGEEGKGEDERCGDVFDGDVGGAGKNFVAGDEFGVGKVDGKVGVGVVAGGVLTAIEVHDRVAYFFDSGTVKESFALLGDDTGDETFLGVVVKDNGVGNVFGIALFEIGAAGGVVGRIENGLGTKELAFEIHTNVVGGEFHSVVFDDAFGVELCFAVFDVDGDGVGCFIVDYAGESIGGVVDEGEGVGGGGRELGRVGYLGIMQGVGGREGGRRIGKSIVF